MYTKTAYTVVQKEFNTFRQDNCHQNLRYFKTNISSSISVRESSHAGIKCIACTFYAPEVHYDVNALKVDCKKVGQILKNKGNNDMICCMMYNYA
jgi:endonuclease III-like uncharacterized protein